MERGDENRKALQRSPGNSCRGLVLHVCKELQVEIPRVRSEMLFWARGVDRQLKDLQLYA